MDSFSRLVFKSPTMGRLGAAEVVSSIAEFVNQQPESFYSVIIGTDSQGKRVNGHFDTKFVTAVIIYRKGRGARYFWRSEKKHKTIHLREKIYTETTISLSIAEVIVPAIRHVISPAKYDLEIHIDVGALGPTRDMIREVVGMVSGNGYKAKTKPESWGASSVADRYA
jgi:predicted RNase H-related nuclease YkuK (DUF458 family)